MAIQKIIGDNLSAWMEANAHLNTDKKLAKKSGVGYGTIQRTRKGEGNVTVGNLEDIAAAFKRPIVDLLVPLDSSPMVQESAAVYSIPSDPTRAIKEEITAILTAADDKGLEVALLAIQNAFAMRKALSPDRDEPVFNQRAGQ